MPLTDSPSETALKSCRRLRPRLLSSPQQPRRWI